MDIVLDENDKKTLFKYKTYDEFTAERLKLSHDHTLKLWYSLPDGLPDAKDEMMPKYTRREQRTALRKAKFLYLYSKVLKRTCLKKRVYEKGE